MSKFLCSRCFKLLDADEDAYTYDNNDLCVCIECYYKEDEEEEENDNE